MANQFLTTDDAAVRLGVARRTVQLWLRQGRIGGAFKVGRDWLIPVESLDDFELPKRGRPPKNKERDD